jgi:hypothetical protein
MGSSPVGSVNKIKGSKLHRDATFLRAVGRAVLVDTGCELATKAPVDSFGPSQTGNLPAQVTFEGRLPWNEAEAEAVLDHGKPSGRKVQALAIGTAY